MLLKSIKTIYPFILSKKLTTFRREVRKGREEKLLCFCRVGSAHHHGMFIGCILSGNV